MSINPITHGTRSRLPRVSAVTPESFDQHLGPWMVMVRDYFSKSYDRTSSPEESFKQIRRRLEGDSNFFLVAHYSSAGIPLGFLAGDLVGEVARILIGYLPQKLSSRDAVIDQALELFDAWAKERHAVGEIFYTYRAPGAHKFMVKRGWSHDMSVYKKEITNG